MACPHSLDVGAILVGARYSLALYDSSASLPACLVQLRCSSSSITHGRDPPLPRKASEPSPRLTKRAVRACKRLRPMAAHAEHLPQVRPCSSSRASGGQLPSDERARCSMGRPIERRVEKGLGGLPCHGMAGSHRLCLEVFPVAAPYTLALYFGEMHLDPVVRTVSMSGEFLPTF